MSRVFLGNLPSDCRVEDIEDFFRDFGKVVAFVSSASNWSHGSYVLQVRNVLIKHGKFGFAEFDRDRWSIYDNVSQFLILFLHTPFSSNAMNEV